MPTFTSVVAKLSACAFFKQVTRISNVSTKGYQQSMLIKLQDTLKVGISCIMFILVVSTSLDEKHLV